MTAADPYGIESALLLVSADHAGRQTVQTFYSTDQLHVEGSLNREIHLMAPGADGHLVGHFVDAVALVAAVLAAAQMADGLGLRAYLARWLAENPESTP